MKAIVTKYIPCSDTRGSRIQATAEGGDKVHRVSISYPYQLSGTDCHAAAAIALCRKMGWKGTLVSGGMPDGKGECFCFVGRKQFDIDTFNIEE